MSKTSKHYDQVINDALNLFRFQGSVFFRSPLASPWGIKLCAEPNIRFHIAIEGGLSVGTTSSNFIQINQGEIIIVSGNQQHWIADSPQSTLTDQSDVLAACNLNSPLFQKGEISHHVICCMISLESGLTHPLLNKLPALLPIRNLSANDEIWPTINLIEQSLETYDSMKNPIVDRLVEILFIQLLSRIIDSDEGEKMIDTLIADRRVFQALNIIHQNPQLSWTVATLGEKVGMSKSTLNRQFLATLGETPINYLTNFRLNKAKSLIKNSKLVFDEIASITGYSSSRSLNKAFSKHFGKSLKHYRNER